MTDKEIADEMTRLEQEYKIPMLAADLEKWLDADPANEAILEKYRTLAGLRTI